MARKVGERMGRLRRATASVNCRTTTARTRYFVRGSWPQSLVTLQRQGNTVEGLEPLDGLFGSIADVFDGVLLGLPEQRLVRNSKGIDRDGRKVPRKSPLEGLRDCLKPGTERLGLVSSFASRPESGGATKK
jgi:hypothetical protein